MRTELNELKQKVTVHEDRVIRLIDDKKLFEIGRDQLRNDIKEFEQLVQDVSLHCDTNLNKIEMGLKNELAELGDRILEVSETAERQNYVLDTQKERFQDLQNQIAWNKYNIEELATQTEDVPTLLRQCAQTEKYLHRILPLKIETQIFNSVQTVTPDDKVKDFMNYTSKRINQLLQDKKNELAEFDKRKYELPDIKNVVDIPDDPSPLDQHEQAPTVKMVARQPSVKKEKTPVKKAESVHL